MPPRTTDRPALSDVGEGFYFGALMETFIMRVGDREWWAVNGDFRDVIIAQTTQVVIRENCFSPACPVNWHSRGFESPNSLIELIWAYDPFGDPPLFSRCSLEYARNVLEEMGHRSTSRELFSLNGPRVYTL